MAHTTKWFPKERRAREREWFSSKSMVDVMYNTPKRQTKKVSINSVIRRQNKIRPTKTDIHSFYIYKYSPHFCFFFIHNSSTNIVLFVFWKNNCITVIEKEREEGKEDETSEAYNSSSIDLWNWYALKWNVELNILDRHWCVPPAFIA